MFIYYSEISNCMFTFEDARRIGVSANPLKEELEQRKLFRLPQANPPQSGPYQYVVENNPTKVGDTYERNYEVREMFPGPAEDPETGETLSVQEQKDRYDAAVQAQLDYEKNQQTITSRQGRQALIELGKDIDALQAIAAIQDEKQRKIINTWYEYEPTWKYDNPILSQFAGILDIDKDEFFALAKTL
jgi:hypothetical protein